MSLSPVGAAAFTAAFADQAPSATQQRLPAGGLQAIAARSVLRQSSASENGGFVELSTTVAICGLLVAAVRRFHARRPRVTRKGIAHHYFQDLPYRPKPSDKYTYRQPLDRWNDPEGTVDPEERGRVVKYSYLRGKGIAEAEISYKLMMAQKASEANRSEGLRGALLLDCDGTLVETERDGHRVAFNRAFKEKGFDFEWDVELYGELLTTGGGKERMTRYFTDYNPDAWPHDDPPAKDHPAIVELHKLKTELFMEIVRAGELELRDGIEELIEAASKEGWLLAVCSTSNEASVTAVVETYLPKYADGIKIFAGDVVKNKKPDPEIYTLAAKSLGIAAMKCVVVEDTAIGCQAGKAAMMSVIVTKSIYSQDEDFAGADLVVGSAAEVNFAKDVEVFVPQMEMA